MNIVSIGPAYPLRGGIADFNQQLAQELSNQSHAVHIVSYYMQYPSFLFPGKTQYVAAQESAPTQVPIQSLIHSLHPLSWQRAASYICSLQPDVIIVHYWMPFFAPALASILRQCNKRSKAKIIALCHNLMPHERFVAGKLLTRFFTKQCHSFVCMSHQVKEELTAVATTKPIAYSPHPIYDNFGELTSKAEACEKLELNPHTPYILFFGLVRAYKGLDLLLEAIAQPAVLHLPCKLIIAGEFYDSPTLYTDIIQRHSLEDKVIIRNSFIPSDEVKYYFSCADLVAQTYKTASQSGITQIAFNFNSPMLVTNVGGLGEIIKHKRMGYVVEPHAKSIAEAIADFYEHDRKEDFSKAVAIEKKRYSWHEFAKLFV